MISVDPLLSQRKSKYRILKDKMIGEQVCKVLDYLHKNENLKLSEGMLKNVRSETSDFSQQNGDSALYIRGKYTHKMSNLEFQT